MNSFDVEKLREYCHMNLNREHYSSFVDEEGIRIENRRTGVSLIIRKEPSWSKEKGKITSKYSYPSLGSQDLIGIDYMVLILANIKVINTEIMGIINK